MKNRITWIVTGLILSLSSHLLAATSATNYPSALPTTLEAAKKQPLSLPDLSATEVLNTPEYVVIRSSDQVTFSSETAASVANLPVKEGSTFHTGDILLELDCRVQNADLQKSIAQQRATSMAELSAEKLERYGSISQFELVKAQSDAAMVNADVARLQAIVDKCVVKAPFNGGVSELYVHPLETVKPGDPLLKIVNTENLELVMQIPSDWLQWLKLNSTFNVHINEINKTITAEVTKINPQIDPISQTVKITGTITPPDPDLKPGMSGQASFPDNPDNQKKKK